MEFLLPIALILVGLGLILVEVYLVPGFNVVGILGFLLMLFAVGVVFAERGIGWGLAALLITAGLTTATFYWLWTSGAWDRFILETTLKADEERVTRETEYRSRYLGKDGVAVTPLRPTGIAEIDGERIEVVTEGDFIAAGSEVRVVAMDRRRYFVRLTDSVSQGATE